MYYYSFGIAAPCRTDLLCFKYLPLQYLSFCRGRLDRRLLGRNHLQINRDKVKDKENINKSTSVTFVLFNLAVYICILSVTFVMFGKTVFDGTTFIWMVK